MIYDRGLLQELIKFNPKGNFDRISALLVLMATRREIEQKEAEQSSRKRNTIYDRQLFVGADDWGDYSDRIPLSEMIELRKKLPAPPPGGELFI